MTTLTDILRGKMVDPSAGTAPEFHHSPLLALAALAQRPVAHGIYYNGKTVQLDGYKFVWCRFDACHLVVTSPTFELDHCVIDEATVIVWRGEIVKTLQLFNSKYQWAYEQLPGFVPTRNGDGTISILTPSQ